MRRPVSARLKSRHAARAFTLVELLVVIAIIGVLVALLLPAVQAAREAARRMNCQSNLKNCALAVLNYENARKVLPAAMKAQVATRTGTDFMPYQGAQLSWIVHVLPYMEMQSLYSRFKIDGTTTIFNQDLQSAPQQAQLPVLMCPSDATQGRFYSDPAYTTGTGGVRSLGKGNYVAYAGPEHMNASIHFSGAINDGGQKLARITDGTSQTIMLTEIRTRDEPLDQRGAWALAWPGASAIALDLHSENLGANNSWLSAGKTDVPYVPGLSQDMPTRANPPNNGLDAFNDDKLRRCADPAGADIDRMPCSDTNESWGTSAPRSLHPGGVNRANVDGSVQWLSDDVNVPMLGAMVCINEGIVITE